MSRLKLFIVLGFGIMFVAGLEVGRAHTSVTSLKAEWRRALANLTGKPQPAPATQPAKSDSSHKLFGEIQLTVPQDEQVHKIYRDARARTDLIGRQFHDADRLHDDEVVAMLDPLQKIEYDEIQRERDQRVTELRSEISAEMEKAGKDVRAILTPDQQKQYDEVKKKFDENKDRGRHGGPGSTPWRGGPGGRHPHGDPETAPGSTPDTLPAHN